MKTASYYKPMLRRFILFGIICVSLLIASVSLAQEKVEKTASPSSVVVDDKKVKDLKEKLATKVAEIRENQKRGFYGEVAAVAKTTFTLVTPEKTEIKVKFTQDTKIFKNARTKTVGTVTDLKNGLKVTVLGLFETEDKTHTAKVIILQTAPQFIWGTVSLLDKKAGTIEIKTENADTYIVEYEKNTTANEYNSDTKKMDRSGLSRIAESDRIQVWGQFSEDDPKKFSAVRILRLPKDIFEGEALGETSQASATPAVTAKTSPKPSASAKASPKAIATPKASAAASPKVSPKASPAE